MQLRDYQEKLSTEAAKLLEWLGIAYLTMEVRTGKTITALTACAKRNAKKVLFVTTKKAISSIEKDYNLLGKPFALVIINFESIHTISDTDFDIIVIDEAHKLGQFPKPSNRTILIKKKFADKEILFLSGTPTPESFSQIFHQFYVSNRSPFKYKNFYTWAKEFVDVKEKMYYGRKMNDYSKAKENLIREHINVYMLTYTQEQAGFQQEVKEEVIYLRVKPATYSLADSLKKDRIYTGKNGKTVLGDTAVKLMTKLHQIYSGSVITEDGEIMLFDRSKANFIKEHFAGKKIAIFYKFQAERMAIITEFGYENLTEDPMEFQNSTKTFMSQIVSGREGIDLSSADALVMYNIDFSSLSYQQARARMQSKDRIKEAMLYWIFAENGIEKKIYDRVILKQDYTTYYFKKDFKLIDKKQTA